MAVGANRIGLQVDRCAAIAAVDGLYFLFQLLDLLRGKRVDKILLFQEVEKTDEVAVATCTCPIVEAHVADHIVSERQRARAMGTLENFGKLRLDRGRVFTDELHELERGAGGELKAFVLVEPERLASCADVDDNLGA